MSVPIPLTLDYGLLTDLITTRIFREPGKSVLLTEDGDDCSHVRLFQPRFSAVGNLLRLEVGVTLQAGQRIAGKCLPPLHWTGRLQLDQRPRIHSRTLTLSFEPVRSRLLDQNGKPVVIADLLWDFARPRIHAELARFQIDLAPPLQEVKGFLEPFLHPAWMDSTTRLLDSMKPGAIQVRADAVSVALQVTVPEVFQSEAKGTGAPLAPAELQQLTELWESWDGLLVLLVEQLAGDRLTEKDRQLLMDVLLDTRYGFQEMEKGRKLGDHFVRRQFVDAWRKLSPIFRRQLYGRGTSGGLGYLAFFTAADGLAAFDRLGPAFGVEISREGLLRLAHMLSGDNKKSLQYHPDVDRRLQQLIFPEGSIEDGGGDAQQERPGRIEAQPSTREESGKEREGGRGGPLSSLGCFLVQPLYAATLPTFTDILKWKVPNEDIDAYVARVRKILRAETAKLVAEKALSPQLGTIFHSMIDAMAWQESCFRQFTVRKGKLTYLLSYNRTSVGLMQVNERVWRGLYNRDRLRWDIKYNARVGGEIAHLYLKRYVLPRLGKKADPEFLASAVYALYNGGPAQLAKFLQRSARGKLYSSDKLFLKKLRWVKQGAWQNISECLGG